MRNIEKEYRLILAVILIFSAIVYIYHLDKESLSTDEYLSLFSVQQSPHDIFYKHKSVLNPNTIPPLYFLILHYWVKLFGTSDFVQRSLSVIFGILSIYSLYRLTRMLFDIRTGIFSALFGALSYNWFLLFRQDRSYSLLILLSLLSFYAFFYLIKNKNSKYPIFYLTIINILLAYTHYFSFLIIILEALFGIFEYRKDKKGLTAIIWMFLIVAIAYLPWYSNLFYDFRREPIIIEREHNVTVSRIIFDIFRITFSDFHFIWSPMLTIIYIPFIIRGIVKLRGKFSHELRHLPAYLILIFIIPFIFLYLVIFTDRERYYAAFMFPLLILLSLGIQDLHIKGIIGKLFVLSIGVFIISNNVLDFADFFNSPSDEKWKQASGIIKQIKAHSDSADILIFQTKYNPPVFAYYFWGPETAAHFIQTVATGEINDKAIREANIKEKIYLIGEMKGKQFFEKLASLPDDSFIWLFRYHDIYFANDFRVENQNRYFFHKIQLNKALEPIDVYLLRRIIRN